MDLEVSRRDQFWRAVFTLLGLAVLTLAGYITYLKWRSPMLDFTLTRYNSNDVYDLVRGGQAEVAGVHAGDVIRRVNGFSFEGWHRVRWEPTLLLSIERGGREVTLSVASVSMRQLAPWWLIGPGLAIAVFWAVSMLLLVRRFQQVQVRLLFLLFQAVTLLAAQLNPYPWPTPGWLLILSVICFHLMLFCFLCLHLVFPVPVGTRCRRNKVMTITLILALALAIFYLFEPDLGVRLSNTYSMLIITAIVIIVGYVYQRRATAADRRRLRLIILSTVLCMTLLVFGLILPNIIGKRPWVSLWQLGPCLILLPLTYLYVTVRHNLFGIDQLLNRTLVYAILSSGILALYLGPVLLLYRFVPDDLPLQMVLIAGVTMLVGLSFGWVRTWVRRGIDRLFYGGWYDYPDVVETISSVLARTIEREQLADTLTRQVPALMQLRGGQLWIGERDQQAGPAVYLSAALPAHLSTNLSDYQPAPLQFPLTFQDRVRGLWTVGARRDGDSFSVTDQRILRTLARQAEVALGNVLLVEMLRCQLDEIRASREMLSQTQRQLLRSREEERARLARDLHDGPIQILVGLNMQLGLMSATLKSSAANGASPLESLDAMCGEVRELLAELRQVCVALRPPMLDTLGLGAAFRALAQDWSSQHDVRLTLDLPSDAALRPLPSEVAVNLYRVVQEALTNVARHAEARHVTLCLAKQSPGLLLAVQDDGRGFVMPSGLKQMTDRGHFGLAGMRERVALIGGKLTVESSPSHGTVVRVLWQPSTRYDE